MTEFDGNIKRGKFPLHGLKVILFIFFSWKWSEALIWGGAGGRLFKISADGRGAYSRTNANSMIYGIQFCIVYCLGKVIFFHFHFTIQDFMSSHIVCADYSLNTSTFLNNRNLYNSLAYLALSMYIPRTFCFPLSVILTLHSLTNIFLIVLKFPSECY